VTFVCTQCGKEAQKRRDHLKERNYCSVKCYADARRVDGAKWRDPAQIKAYNAQYYQANRGAALSRARVWGGTNRTLRLKIQRRYRQRHQLQVAAATRARRAGQSAGAFTAADWEDMKRRYAYRCLCCGRAEPAITLEADHIVAPAKGGPHVAANIQPLCRSCNASKGVRATDYRP
jgi:5-methylcytosine-specific restriction endonuclease McrA